MMTENSIELAYFEVNQHGRLLSGNRRFCRMFGFEPSELQWHYVTDLYRYASDWNAFRNDTVSASFNMRMRNRRGRSFDCCITREIIQNADGEIIFRNTVHKVGEGKAANVATTPLSVVFLAKCADCGAQIRVTSVAETRLRMLCNHCAAKAFPETFYAKSAQM
ncbi:PAS domain-containing protein [Fibrobacter sp. UWB10]|jgi:PAS domain S-box-containing protein|uniref:PAS domain-containing protein n=1 Tax=Fibrobacter sp. UWB10 TaxID=1896201 RepID=UPI00156AEF8A|nr:PAS domain-containing protein [Fibrobacter sp. UWB10]MBO7512116.1 PAS domain S-box protein [Fibrobacter sp.]SMP48669.1 PAS domain S-box-containing protein [Fibrobacter sp. UWB10]